MSLEWASLVLQVIELGFIVYIAYEGYLTLQVERKNLSLYQQYFDERVKWRLDKRKQREQPQTPKTEILS